MLIHTARSVLLILFLLAGSLSPPLVSAQAPRSRVTGQSELGFSLEKNSPSPVASETYIPFTLEPSLFEQSDSAIVSLRIYNILNQVVALPTRSNTPVGRTQELVRVSYYEPGRIVAYWDGRDIRGQRLPAGVYYARLEVNGDLLTGKIVVFR